MKNIEMDPNTRKSLDCLAALSDGEKGALLNELAEKRRKNFDIEKQTNAEIAAMEEFKTFCLERNIESSKRQAGKNRTEFIEWYKKCKNNIN